MNLSDYFIYDITSPSGLRWADTSQSGVEGKGKAERKPGTVAGSCINGTYHLQVTEEEQRYRFTAHRVIWELHNDPADGMVILHREGTSNNIENLFCVTRTQHNLIKAWRSGKPNVTELPSGRFYATIRGQRSLGTYDTYAEAESTYREALWELIKDLF